MSTLKSVKGRVNGVGCYSCGYRYRILSFTAVNACPPSMRSVFHGVKHIFRVEDLVMWLRVFIFAAIFKDKVSYEVQRLCPMFFPFSMAHFTLLIISYTLFVNI